jgi:ParB family chromosome partitioning protein
MSSFTQAANEHTPKPGVPLSAMPAPEDLVLQIPVSSISPSPFNPRQTFEGIDELAASIAEQGLLENLVVRKAKKAGLYELIAGERRWRALKLLKRATAPCKVLEADDAAARAAQIVENLQREDIGAMEEAKAFAALQDQDHKTWTPQAIAKVVGKTDRFVQQRIQMARNLSTKAQKAMADGSLKIEVARTLAIAPKTVQDKLLDEIDDWDFDRMTADELRGHILEEMVPVEIAAFDLALYKGGYHDEGKKRFFTDVEQFNHLQAKAAEALATSLKAQWPAARVVEDRARFEYCWGDTGHPIYAGADTKKKATGALKVAREKLTALVWIHQGHVKSVEGVGLSSLFRKASSGGSSAGYSGPARESAEQRRYRQAYNEAVFTAVAGRPDFALRVLLTRFIDGTTRFTYDHTEAKKGHEAILPKDLLAYINSSFQHAKTVKLWAAVKKLKADDVAAMVARYTARSLSWQSGYMGGKKPPEFTALLAGETKAKLPAREGAKPKAKGKAAKAKPRAKAKVKAKKKGGRK